MMKCLKDKWKVVVVFVCAVSLAFFVGRSTGESAVNLGIQEETEEVVESETATEAVQEASTVIEEDMGAAITLGGKAINSNVDSVMAEQLTTLEGYISAIYNNNGMLFVVSGEEDENDSSANKIVEAYNKDKTAYIEYYGNIPEFHYARGRAVLMSDVVERVQNLTTLDLLQGIIDIAKSNTDGIEITRKVQDVYENDDVPINIDAPAEAERYNITDDGVEKVENEADPEKDRGAYLFTETITTIKIYRDVVEKYYLEEFGEEYRDTFAFDDVWELAKNDSTSDDFIYFNFVTSNIDNQMGAGEYLVVDGNTYLSWYFDNHFVLTDWSINTDEWRKSHTAEEFIQLAIEVQQDVEDATRQLESEMDEILEVYKREDEMQDERADGEGLTNPKSQGDGDTDSEAESLVSAEDVTDENSTANTDGTESIDSTESVGSTSNTDEGTSEESKSDSNNNN